MVRRRRSKSGSWIVKTMRARPTRRELVYKKRALTRKAKTRRIEIVSRRGQPQITAVVQQLKEQIMGGVVSSSWIAGLYWKGKWVLMELINGYSYNVYIPFRVFEEWYYAHSKGTFFNGNIKDKFKVVRSA